jgi:hypothetical protein
MSTVLLSISVADHAIEVVVLAVLLSVVDCTEYFQHTAIAAVVMQPNVAARYASNIFSI